MPFAMLGLGDIVIPGIFVALILRYDASRHFKSKYFVRCAPILAKTCCCVNIKVHTFGPSCSDPCIRDSLPVR